MVKRLMSVAILALLALVALSACGSESSSEEATVTRIPNPKNAPVIGSPTAEESGGGGETAATEVNLKMVDIAFEPKNFTIAANTDVVIRLENVGAGLHNFTVESLGISEDVNPGETKDVTINTGPSELDYYCDVPGHRQAGMEGTITVSEGGAAAPAGTAAASPEGSPSPGASPAGKASATPAAAAPVTVELEDIKFVPPDITVPANSPTKVTLKNTGASPHTFTVEDLGIDEELQPGETREIEINAAAGSYELICKIPGHAAAGMVGTVTAQ
jgi:uncharacterized cupredoxin-like copper-binding protein